MRKIIYIPVIICLNIFQATNLYAQRNQTDHRQIQQLIEETYRLYRDDNTGKNADYIPFLANVPSHLFGITVITNDGQMFSVGDTNYEFGIESISKVLVLAQAMEIMGPDFIENNIGVGATGMPFNSVLAIELEGQKPVSPIVNGGAMATNSLIKGINKEDQFGKILAYMSKWANRPLRVIDELYQSEAASNEHNKAIAMLLASYGHMWSDPLDACDSYTLQCSVGITTKDLANIAGVLANEGRHPITKEQLINPSYIPKILAVMGMEGLYENTGSWMYRVGLPSKSGVGGGIFSVVPGKMAIAVFAPPLDEAGNSVKAQKAIQYIAGKFRLNVYTSMQK